MLPIHRGKARQQQRGVALIAALFALMLISALALAMVFSTTTESSVSANFRDSRVAEYAANAGIQQGRERLMPSAADYLGGNTPATLPTLAGGVVYITNPAGPGDTIQPTNPGNTYFDDELCHENFAGLLLANTGDNVPCASGPPAAAVTTVPSDAPDTNTAAALNFKWIRITQKARWMISGAVSRYDCTVCERLDAQRRTAM